MSEGYRDLGPTQVENMTRHDGGDVHSARSVSKSTLVWMNDLTGLKWQNAEQ